MAKVLLCDDEEALCRGMARLLRSVSYEVITADGPGGLDKLAHESFDAVVTDLRMPGVDGFGILDAVRLKSCLHHRRADGQPGSWKRRGYADACQPSAYVPLCPT